MTTLWLDLETFSETPIRHGTYRYAEDSEIMLLAWAIDDAPAEVWDATLRHPLPSGDYVLNRMPDALSAALFDESVEVVAHNVTFDRTVLRLSRNLQTEVPIPRWRCTMARALAHALPAALGDLCAVLQVPTDQTKEKAGKQLVQFFCKPRPKNSKIRRATRETHPVEWERFVDYARLDVEAMRACAKRMPDWNYTGEMLASWHLDQLVNDRGVAVDVVLAEAVVRATTRERAALAERTHQLTDGAVNSATRRDLLLAHVLAEHGVELPNLQADTIERRAADPDLPEGLRELLRVRLASASASPAKYAALLRGVSSDGRLRGTIQWCGAGRTGRAAGRLFQPQNMARLDEDAVARWADVERPTDEQVVEYLETGVAALKADAADLVFEEVTPLIVNLVRGSLVAPPERILNVSDLAGIEGRVAAWLAGEDWKLDAYRAYDLGVGQDSYQLAYARAFAVDPATVSGSRRQIGKIMELMLQYQGGVGAFITGAETYGVDLEAMAVTVLPTLPDDVKAEARGFLSWLYEKPEDRHTFRLKHGADPIESLDQLEAERLRARLGLSENAFVACDSLKRLWRRAHPQIETTWGELETAVKAALAQPGRVAKVGRYLTIDKTKAWLRIQLPSGRYLCYPGARVEPDGGISYMGVHQYTKRWQRIYTYGGKLFENAVQAAARDVLYGAAPRAEAEGYALVMHVHDELICEVPDDGMRSAAHLGDLLSTPPAWALDLPLSAGGFEAARYRQD